MAHDHRQQSKNQGDGKGATTGYEAELWRMADALRGSMDTAEYKYVFFSLIFLKYISDAFEEAYVRLQAEGGQGADPEDPDEYRAARHSPRPRDARREDRAEPPDERGSKSDGTSPVQIAVRRFRPGFSGRR